MALTIAGGSPLIDVMPTVAALPRAATQAKGAGRPPASAPPGGSAGGQASGGSAASSNTQQQAALKQLLATYAADQSHGAAASTLSALGKQIMADAKALGQTVTLPSAPASSTASSAASTPSAAIAASDTGKLDVTA